MDLYDPVMKILDNSTILTTAEFVLTLDSCPAASKQSELDKYRKTALAIFWTKFTYMAELRKDQLCDLLTMSLELDVISQADALETICAAFRSLEKWRNCDWDRSEQLWQRHDRYYEPDRILEYVNEVLVSLVGAIINQEQPFTVVEEDSRLFPMLSSWMLAVLSLYVTRAVGKEPQAPPNWSIEKHRGCGRCKLCAKIGEFMQDAKKQTFKAVVSEEVNKHLCDKFYVSKHATYDSFDTTSEPQPEKPGSFLWTCTKKHKKYEKEHGAWAERRAHTELRLRSIGVPQADYLRPYLGEHHDAIMSCRVEQLPQLDMTVFAEPPDKLPSIPDLPVEQPRVTAHSKKRANAAEERDREELEMLIAEGAIPPPPGWSGFGGLDEVDLSDD